VLSGWERSLFELSTLKVWTNSLFSNFMFKVSWPILLVSNYIKWVKTSWTWTNLNIICVTMFSPYAWLLSDTKLLNFRHISSKTSHADTSAVKRYLVYKLDIYVYRMKEGEKRNLWEHDYLVLESLENISGLKILIFSSSKK